MIKIEALSRELVDGVAGQPVGGCDFYWQPGSEIVLVHEWEHRCSGRDYLPISPDPMWGNDLEEYIKGSWSKYVTTRVILNYR